MPIAYFTSYICDACANEQRLEAANDPHELLKHELPKHELPKHELPKYWGHATLQGNGVNGVNGVIAALLCPSCVSNVQQAMTGRKEKSL